MIPPVRARLSLSKIFPAVLFFGLLAMTARPAVDPDLWWHLRTGQWIMETGHIPHVDPFSFTRAGNPWVAHEWLSEVTFYEIWKYSGEAGLIIFSAIVTTAGFMLLYLRSLGKASWTAAVVTLGALASAPTWGVRPQMFTFALASLLLWLLESGGEKPCLLLWIPPLFLLWLNLHAGFAFGPVLLVAFCLGLIAESAIGENAMDQNTPPAVPRTAGPNGVRRAGAFEPQRGAALSLSAGCFCVRQECAPSSSNGSRLIFINCIICHCS